MSCGALVGAMRTRSGEPAHGKVRIGSSPKVWQSGPASRVEPRSLIWDPNPTRERPLTAERGSALVGDVHAVD